MAPLPPVHPAPTARAGSKVQETGNGAGEGLRRLDSARSLETAAALDAYATGMAADARTELVLGTGASAGKGPAATHPPSVSLSPALLDSVVKVRMPAHGRHWRRSLGMMSAVAHRTQRCFGWPVARRLVCAMCIRSCASNLAVE